MNTSHVSAPDPKRLTKLSELPEGKHFCLLHEETIAHDDGYGGTRRDEFLAIDVFFKETDWQLAIVQDAKGPWTYGHKPAKGVVIIVPKVEVVVTVKVD